MDKQEVVNLLQQEDRTSSDGRGGAIVPGPLPSSSNDEPTSGCTAGPLAEEASAKISAEENERAGLPKVLIPPIDKERRRKPGPACSKTRVSGPRTRSSSRSGSRSSSAASVITIRSDVAATVEETRKTKRELEMDLRRCMAKAASNRAKSNENLDVMVLSDDEEDTEEMHSGSDTEYVEVQELNKKKKKRKRKSQRSIGESSKRGRPPTTGEYVGLAEAKEALNAQRKEEERLDREKKIRQLSAEDLLNSMGIDMEDEIESARHGPTADLANRAREGMLEVLRVAKISSSIKSDLRKVLKNAAASATAVVEILRTRADCPADTDVPRQIKALKEEVRLMKAEVAHANEEAKRLRKELAGTKDKKETRSQRKRIYVEDSPPSSPGGGQREGETEQAAESAVDAPMSLAAEESTPMEIENAVGEETQEKPPKYCDVRRKGEILPPREEWPPIIRPAIKGKVKILEDRPLTGHEMRLVEGRTTKRAETSLAAKGTKEEKGGAHLLLEQLTPLLQKWLEENLRSRGLSRGPDEGEVTTAKAGSQPGTGPKSSKKMKKPDRPQAGGTEEAKGKVVQSTAVPNAALWSRVVGGRTGEGTPPLSQAERKQPSLDAEDPGAWQTVAKRKVKKTAPQKTVVTAKQGEAGPPPRRETPGEGREEEERCCSSVSGNREQQQQQKQSSEAQAPENRGGHAHMPTW